MSEVTFTFGIFAFIVLTFVFGILGGWIAEQKGRRHGEGMTLGFLFGPFGCVIEALLPTLPAAIWPVPKPSRGTVATARKPKPPAPAPKPPAPHAPTRAEWDVPYEEVGSGAGPMARRSSRNTAT